MTNRSLFRIVVSKRRRGGYGIDNVLVSDFDEFFYCPMGKSKPETQAAFIHKLFKDFEYAGVDHLSYHWRVVANKTSSARSCLIDKYSRSESIFECFAPYDYAIYFHSKKSIHLGLKCPMTTYHGNVPDFVSIADHCVSATLLF